MTIRSGLRSPSSRATSCRAGRVATKHAVLAAQPQITWPRDGDGGQQRRLVCPFLVHWIAQERVKFVNIETGQAEVKIKRVQIRKLGGQKAEVPSRLLVRSIVHQAVGPDLLRCQIIGDVDRKFLPAQLECSKPPYVTNDDDGPPPSRWRFLGSCARFSRRAGYALPASFRSSSCPLSCLSRLRTSPGHLAKSSTSPARVEDKNPRKLWIIGKNRFSNDAGIRPEAA